MTVTDPPAVPALSFRRRGINASVVRNVPEVLENPQLKARDYWVDLERPPYPGHFFLSDETDNVVRPRIARGRI